MPEPILYPLSCPATQKSSSVSEERMNLAPSSLI
jgi:hypothetical protein